MTENIHIKETRNIGITDVLIGDCRQYGVSYEGIMVSPLCKTEEEAIGKALELVKRTIETPVLVVGGYDFEQAVGVYDKIRFMQVVETKEEHCLVIGTDSGAMADLFYCEKSVGLCIEMFSVGMSLPEVLSVCGQLLSSKHAS